MTHENIAKVAHEMNKAYCQAIGDNTQTSWEDAPEWQKESAIKGVQFHCDNPESTPEDSHKSWQMQKVADGWVYGKVKDAIKKHHPCMVAYKDLPVNQKAKDYLFKQTVESLRGFIDQPVAAAEVVEEPTVVPGELTFGMKAVGLNFNPSKSPQVRGIKQLAANLVDELNNQRGLEPRNGDKAALYTLAIRSAEVASLRGVSAATWEH